MTVEAASALDIPITVLSEREDDAAAKVASQVLIGTPIDPGQLWALAARCEVVTFDHELVDLDVLTALETSGVRVRPSVKALRTSVDKSFMRNLFTEAGIPVPAFQVLGDPASSSTAQEIEDFATNRGWPVILKSIRGGYDGRGVWVASDLDEAVGVCQRSARNGANLIVEEQVRLEAELAVLVARSPNGEVQVWRPVTTTQVGGVCRETLMAGTMDRELTESACDLARRIAELIDVVGVLAVEMFWSGASLLVNEVATRPHNTGHWTIEGSVTSQFENHLRAILDLPLGRTDATADHVATVNIFGSDDWFEPALGLADALAVPGAHVHLYGKASRPGRKLGHVTVCGTDVDDVRNRAWASARALGTPVPDAIKIANNPL